MLFNTNKTIYLCGSMSGLKGYGAGWRKRLTKWLALYGLKVYDPCVEETAVAKEYTIPKSHRQHWEKFPQPLQEEIMKTDMRQVRRKSSFVICFFTRYSTGTVSEITEAGCYDVPTYIVTNRKLVGWPGTVSRMDGNHVFKSFDKLMQFLVFKYKLKKVKHAISSTHSSRSRSYLR